MASFGSRLYGRFIRPYIGNPKMLQGPTWQRMEEKSKFFKWWNNSLNAAPGFKWVLSIVPFYGVVVGLPTVENIDLKQSGALAFTGIVWTCYAMLVKPRAWLLFACNIALLGVNGYNVSRKLKYESDKKQALEAPK